MTTMVTTFIPAGKVPVIALIAGAMLPDYAGSGSSSILHRHFAVIVSGIALRKQSFCGDPSPFVMELPRIMPPLRDFGCTWERGSSFIKKAGTIILYRGGYRFLSNFGISGGSVGMVEGNKSFPA